MLVTQRGFTLLELLIVVAIIGILASIITPNYIHARLRALVVRSIADSKNCQVAIEQYCVDNAKYPFYNNPDDEVSAISGASVTYLPVSLTTPISYLSQLPYDPFLPDYIPESEIIPEKRTYKYIHGYDQIYKKSDIYRRSFNRSF